MNISAHRKFFIFLLLGSLVLLLVGFYLYFQSRKEKDISTFLSEKMYQEPSEMEIIVYEDFFVVRGVLTRVESVGDSILLEMEVWNHNENKYLVKQNTIDKESIVNIEEILLGNDLTVEPSIAELYIYTKKPSLKESLDNLLESRSFNPSLYIEKVVISFIKNDLEEKINNNSGYISESIHQLTLSMGPPYPNSIVAYYLDTGKRLFATDWEIDSNIEVNYNTIKNLQEENGKYEPPVSTYLNLNLLNFYPWYSNLTLVNECCNSDMSSSRDIWNDSETMLTIQNKLEEIRYISRYLYYTAKYYNQNSLDCSKKENLDTCDSLVNIYNYNKSLFLADSFPSITKGYGVCSVTYYLPELISLTNNENLRDDLNLVTNSYDFLGECTITGGGRGLCSKDIKESIYCGLIMKEEDLLKENLKTLVKDRYAFFREVSYKDGSIANLSAKNFLADPYNYIPEQIINKSAYIIYFEDHVNFLDILDYTSL